MDIAAFFPQYDQLGCLIYGPLQTQYKVNSYSQFRL